MRGGHYNLALVMTGFTRGLYQLGRSVMYVNRGIGVAGPAVRFNCRPEMAVCSQNSSATSDELIAAVEAVGQAASCQTYRW